jgi:hypothetical protein
MLSRRTLMSLAAGGIAALARVGRQLRPRRPPEILLPVWMAQRIMPTACTNESYAGSQPYAPLAIGLKIAAALLAWAILIIHVSSDAAEQGRVTIHVKYINKFDRLLPNPRDGIVSEHNLTVILSGANEVVEKWDSRSGQLTRQSASQRVLGGSDSERGGRWQVVGPKQLVRRIEYPQNSTIITITVTGEKSCQAAIDYVLKPGYREFTLRMMANQQLAYYRNVRTISSSCEIQSDQGPGGGG